MAIYLGNLSTQEIEHRTGVKFSDALVEYMKDRHQPQASNIVSGKWHCFDIPFVLVCGDMETAQTIYDQIKHRSDEFKVPLQISLNS